MKVPLEAIFCVAGILISGVGMYRGVTTGKIDVVPRFSGDMDKSVLGFYWAFFLNLILFLGGGYVMFLILTGNMPDEYAHYLHIPFTK